MLNTGLPALFDEKSGNPKLIKRGEWGFGDRVPSDFQDFSIKIKHL